MLTTHLLRCGVALTTTRLALVRFASSAAAAAVPTSFAAEDTGSSGSHRFEALVAASAKRAGTSSMSAGGRSALSFGNASAAQDEEPVIRRVNEDDAQGGKTFSDFGLNKALVAALSKQNITVPSPIQAATLEASMLGGDVVARAKTGSGKTLAFVLPILHQLSERRLKSRPGMPRALILTPTRELCLQISNVIEMLQDSLQISSVAVYGGTPYEKQERAFYKGVDIIVGTPGRLYDFLQRGAITLDKIESVTLDEADEMLDRGFRIQVEQILSYAQESNLKRQTLLFSATLPSTIVSLTKQFMNKPKFIDMVSSETSSAPASVKHTMVYLPPFRVRRLEYVAHLLGEKKPSRTIVFVARKDDVDNTAAILAAAGHKVVGLHSDLSQSARDYNMERFRQGRANVLVATDVAARGIDVPDTELVIQMDIPNTIEFYLHRSGRTGRAGRAGEAIVFLNAKTDTDFARSVKRVVPGALEITVSASSITPLDEEILNARPNPTKSSRDTRPPPRSSRDEGRFGHSSFSSRGGSGSGFGSGYDSGFGSGFGSSSRSGSGDRRSSAGRAFFGDDSTFNSRTRSNTNKENPNFRF